MYDKNSRIFFEDNPYPMGHKLKAFQWIAELKPDLGIWFHLHLETENYYAEDDTNDPEDMEYESDWKAKVAWGNFHSCRISSSYWHDGGFLGASESKKFDFSSSEEKAFHLDKLPRPDDFDYDNDMVFGIYLLGHDDCANHKINFKKQIGKNFTINWNGEIALAYMGDYEFKYKFHTEIKEVKMDGIICPANLSDDQISSYLSKYSIGFEDIKIIKEELKE